MAINGQAAGDVSQLPTATRGWATLPSDQSFDREDEQRASANVGQINARTARLPWERTALSATLDDLRGMDWRHELALNGSIGGTVLA